MQKRQASTLQMVRTKNPKAKKQLERFERRMPERGMTFFLSEPSPSIIRLSYEATPRKEGGRCFSKNKICAHRLLGLQLVNRRKWPAKHKPQTYEMGTPTNQVRERGETFFLKFLSHLTPRVQTTLTKPKNTGSVFSKCNKASRRMHTSKHLEGCTHQSISKDAQIKHLEGCTYQNTPKDANKASRRMRRSKHLEGCTF